MESLIIRNINSYFEFFNDLMISLMKTDSNFLNLIHIPDQHTYSEKLRSMLNEVFHGIVLIDENDIIQEVNKSASKMFKFSPTELVKKELDTLVVESQREDLSNYIQTCKSDKSAGRKEFLFIGKQSEKSTLELDFDHYFLDEESGHLNCIGLVYDVTKRKKLEKEVELHKNEKEEIIEKLEKELELSDMKSRFISIASHEFRTPLAGILSSIDLAERYLNAESLKWKQFTNKPKIETHFESIKTSIRSLTSTLNQFLSLGQLEEGTIEYRPKIFDLKKMLENQIEEFDHLKKNDQTIEFHFEGEETEVCLDNNMLRNVISNLLSNAVKYTSANKNIEVSAHVSTENISITVKDQGMGIPESEQKNLFRRFFRAKNVTNLQGTGLGLNIVRKYMDMMNGKITFDSQENVGTSFYLTFDKSTIQKKNIELDISSLT